MDFDSLLRSLLARGKLRDDTIDKILSKYRSHFEAAFIHKSFDAKRNYEMVEELGDLVLNMAIVNYVSHKFPNIQSVHWRSNIKHRLISAKSFATLAEEIGFYPHIKISDKIKQDIESKIERAKEKREDPIVAVKDYRALLEDVFEAFTGTLQWVVNDYSGLEAGPGYAVCYEFMKSFLDLIEIPTTVEDVFDPITRVKEIYDDYHWPNSTNDMTISYKNLETGEWTSQYVVYTDELKKVLNPSLHQLVKDDMAITTRNFRGFKPGDLSFLRYRVIKLHSPTRGEMLGFLSKGNLIEIDNQEKNNGQSKTGDVGNFPSSYVKNITVLASASSLDKTEARRRAATQTLEILKNKYGITKRVKSAVLT